MMTSPVRRESELDQQCEDLIIQYEYARGSGKPFDVASALNSVPAAMRAPLAIEIACIDLERCCGEDGLPEVSPILGQFPQLFASEQNRIEVAREHYRLCRVAGLNVSRESIAKLYRLRSAQWDVFPTVDNQQQYPRPSFPSVGESFCGYPLIAELGRGAFAQVYLARQPDLAQRLVVLKVTPKVTSEADRLARLQHSGIVPVYSVHRHADLSCICMPFLGTLTLANLIDESGLVGKRLAPTPDMVSTIVADRLSTMVCNPGTTIAKSDSMHPQLAPAPAVTSVEAIVPKSSPKPMSAQEFSEALGASELTQSLNRFFLNRPLVEAVVSVMTKVVEALAYAHQHHVVHRDLKPENILIANDGQPVLLDFHLASEESDQRNEVIGGTLPYMSPQHMRALNGNGAVSTSDDVYSVGVILYQLLTGRLPFVGSSLDFNNLEATAKLREQSPAPCRSLEPRVPPSLNAIVMKCLAPEPADRYPRAGELLEDLERFSQHRRLRYAPDRDPWEYLSKWARRHPTLTSSTMLLVISSVCIASLAVLLLGSRQRFLASEAERMASDLASRRVWVTSLLQTPGREQELLTEGLREGRNIISQWRLDSPVDSPLARLQPNSRQWVNQTLAEMLSEMSNAQVLVAMAKGHSAQKEEFRQAIDWLSTIARLNPEATARSKARAAALNEWLLTGKWNTQKANTIVNPGLADATQSPVGSRDQWFYDAIEAMQRRDLLGWEDAINHWLDDHPEDPSRWFSLGAARWAKGDAAGAKQCFEVAARLQRHSWLAVFWRGVCELQTGELATAKVSFDQCLALRPKWMPALVNRALAYRGLGKAELALADLDQCIVDGQRSVRLLSLRSQLLQSLGRVEEAAQDRAAAIALTPVDPDDWVARGLLQLPSSTEEAVEDFRRALATDPIHIAALQNLAHVQSEITHQAEEAIVSLSELARLRPKEATYLASRGIILGRLGRSNEAMQDAENASKLPLRPIEMLQLAGIYSLCSQSQPDSQALALRWLQKAILAEPGLRNVAATDPDLAVIRPLGQFRQLIDQP